MKDRLILASLVLAAFVLQGCQHMGADEGDVEVVEMRSGNVFAPDNLTITAGATVLWRNVDNVQHNVVSLDPQEDWGMTSGELLGGGERFEHTFDEPGTYEYRCEPHSSMQEGECSGMCGTIIVEQADQEQGTT